MRATEKEYVKKSTTDRQKLKLKIKICARSSLEYSGSQVYPALPSFSKSDPHSVKEYVSSISSSEQLISVACAAIMEIFLRQR